MKKTNPRKFLSPPSLSNLLTSTDQKTHCKDLGIFEEDFLGIRILYTPLLDFVTYTVVMLNSFQYSNKILNQVQDDRKKS
jgi:hypothetical protein